MRRQHRGTPIAELEVPCRRLFSSLALALPVASLLVALVSESHANPLRAEQITPLTVEGLQIGGADAIGGVGDWYLANDIVEVIVDDPSREFATLNHGGTIVDVGLRSLEDEDQFARLWPLLNLDQRVQVGFDRIEARVDVADGTASLRVWSEGGVHPIERGGRLARLLDPLVPSPEAVAALRIETVYRVALGESFVRIETTLRNTGAEPVPIFAYGDVWMRGGRSTRSFVGNTLAPGQSRGFHHRSFDRASVLTAGEAFAAFTHVSVPGMPGRPPIAYAIAAPERAAKGLVQFGVTGHHITFVNAFTSDPDWNSLDVWRLLRSTRGEIAPGRSWTFERRLLVVDEASVSATTDPIFAAVGTRDGRTGIAARVDPADVPVGVSVADAESGAPVTHIRTRGGALRAQLPPGRYSLEVRAPHRALQRLETVVTEGEIRDFGPIVLPATGRLRFAPAFSDGGAGRVIVLGEDGTADPIFGDELLDFRVDGRRGKSGSETRELLFLGNRHDPTEVEIAPGSYRMLATRGLEHEVVEQRVRVAAGELVSVAPFGVERAVSMPGWVRADLHVHGDASSDSGVRDEARLRSYVAEGIDAFVATDHDNVGSYASALEALDLGDRLLVVPGIEVTSSGPSYAAPWTIGHHNAWPIERRPDEHRGGAPRAQGLSMADLYSELRREQPVRVIQLNHPRSKLDEREDGSLLTHLASAGESFEPDRPLDEPPNDALLVPGSDGTTRAIDFDAIEVINGEPYGAHRYELMRRDWYALLRQGQRKTGTANSDTHGPAQIAAYPRNYLDLKAGQHEGRSVGTSGGAWAGPTAEALDEAVLAGRLVGTTGPLVREFSVGGVGMGGLATASDGRVSVSVVVEAAPWVPVDEVRILVDGEIRNYFKDLPSVPAASASRLATTFELSLQADAFITIEAGAPLGVDPNHWIDGNRKRGGIYADVASDFVSIAFTNPIYVDVDGDGRYEPRGVVAASGPPFGWLALVVLAIAAWGWSRLRGRAGHLRVG